MSLTLMKKNYLLLLPALALTMTSCDAIAGIFKAGFNIGIIVAVLVAVGIIWLIARMFGGRK